MDCKSMWDDMLMKFVDHRDIIMGILTVYAQPLMYLALLIGLLFLGINEIYVKNPVFGTDPFPDYLAAFTWGLGSEVLSRTLSNLKGS
ncbi:MAG: hypothetical protein GKC10_06650 [Methanosarcinales archaeon]|nr:hypothetical protein [Methanosarcinales archaeon]